MIRGHASWVCTHVIIALGGVLPLRSGAQTLGLTPGQDLPMWIERWTALSHRADLPRRFASAGPALARLAWPAPTIGLFWHTGNPAGLPFDIVAARADMWSAMASQRGEFRRPLDAGATELRQLSAQAWRPVGTRSAMIGRVTLDQETLAPGSQADVTEPFGSSPFVVTDTSITPVRRTRARLEGAAGWRVGAWSLGAAVGYETRDHSTIDAGFVRRARRVSPGTTLGVSRALGSAKEGPRVGVHIGWTGQAETVQLNERATEGRVYQLEGYREVRPIDVLDFYYRRMQVSERSAGIEAVGLLRSIRWSLAVDVARREQQLWRQQQNDPAKDRWEARAWGASARLQRALSERRWLLTAEATWRALDGNGDLALDSTGSVFSAKERSWLGAAELRWTPDSSWRALASLSIAGERRDRRDSVADVRTTLESRTPLIAIEIARQVTRQLELLVGLSRGIYQARGLIPNPAAQGSLYRRLIARELQLYATDARPESLTLAATWRLANRTKIWLLSRAEILTASDPQPQTVFTPAGDRRATTIVLGASW